MLGTGSGFRILYFREDFELVFRLVSLWHDDLGIFRRSRGLLQRVSGGIVRAPRWSSISYRSTFCTLIVFYSVVAKQCVNSFYSALDNARFITLFRRTTILLGSAIFVVIFTIGDASWSTIKVAQSFFFLHIQCLCCGSWGSSIVYWCNKGLTVGNLLQRSATLRMR